MKKILLVLFFIFICIISISASLDPNDYMNNPESEYYINQYLSSVGTAVNNPDRYYNNNR